MLTSFSRVHYKEYLVDLINRSNIDPVTIMLEDDLHILLRRWEKPIPDRLGTETDAQYRTRLIQVSINSTCTWIYVYVVQLIIVVIFSKQANIKIKSKVLFISNLLHNINLQSVRNQN